MRYADRFEAGHTLGESLAPLRAAHPLVLGLPRGGVPVAYAVRQDLGGDLDILLVRKLGVPWQPELAMGAIGEDGIRLMNESIVADTRVADTDIALVEAHERAELERRSSHLRGGVPSIPMEGRTVVIVDDGMATGATAAVGCAIARIRHAVRIVLAVPVSSPEAIDRLEASADDVICPYCPANLGGVGAAYDDFHQLEDNEVIDLLRR